MQGFRFGRELLMAGDIYRTVRYSTRTGISPNTLGGGIAKCDF